jgi:DTW domain-containing protein YfiP
VVRRTSRLRCVICGLIDVRCICSGLDRCRLPWRLVIVQHGKEGAKPTNTARLLAAVVLHSRLLPFATRTTPWSRERLGAADEPRFLLHPGEDATPLDRARVSELARIGGALVIVDGSWRQSGRMVRRGDGLRELPRFALPAGPPSRWTVRRAPRAGFVSTLESVVRLAALLDDPEPHRVLEATLLRLLAAQNAVSVPLA